MITKKKKSPGRPKKPDAFVQIQIHITPQQLEWLRQKSNYSLFIRTVLDAEMDYEMRQLDKKLADSFPG